MIRKLFLSGVLIFIVFEFANAQPDRWQQHVKYTMKIDVNANTNIFTGDENIVYTNNSPDFLKKIFIHLYWNAFQPGSSMDLRSQELGKNIINQRPDWDPRVANRIAKLKPEEYGYQKIISLKINGVEQKFLYHETILEVQLSQPIAPKTSVNIDLQFESQIPLQVRRSGRDNPKTGVKYSMSQWYPKICEYDYEGWHPTPYIAREFYGVWGDYDVSINIDKSYKLGGTGVLVNASEIGWGYDVPNSPFKNINSEKRNWHFVGKNIHDFVWAADKDYKHISSKTATGVVLHVIYNAPNKDLGTDNEWKKVLSAAENVFPFIEKNFGTYPYPQYSFIQGGDGGMEYPMATLIHSPYLGTVFHEWMHSWYQMILGTNESMYAWMDEGFTSYGEDVVNKFYTGNSSLQSYISDYLKDTTNKSLLERIQALPNDHADAYSGYFTLTKSGLAEPLTTHADHYNTNFGYSISSYSKGEIFLSQLGYIVGDDVRDKILLEYYNQWRFKHPNANDFMVIAQNISGMQLDWYKMYWINTTKTIDYSIDSVWMYGSTRKIRLARVGEMPMPIDVEVSYTDGSSEVYTIPLDIMFGNKDSEDKAKKFIVAAEWKWTAPNYVLNINSSKNIKRIAIDPSNRMADIDRSNNVIQ